jgi:small subunit ribosomal protein S6
MIVSPEASEDDVSAAQERVDGLVQGGGGEMTHHETWGLRRLAYPIQKFQEGSYLLSRFTARPETALQVERTLTADQGVIRHLVVKV